MICPVCANAGQEVVLQFRESDVVETHGLECGPYEHWHYEWWECPECGAEFTGRELDELEAKCQNQ